MRPVNCLSYTSKLVCCHNYMNFVLFIVDNTGDGYRCAGPCAVDADCKRELEFFRKVEYVPGCVTGRHGGVSGMNYCYQVPPNGVTQSIYSRNVDCGGEWSNSFNRIIVAYYCNYMTKSEVFQWQ